MYGLITKGPYTVKPVIDGQPVYFFDPYLDARQLQGLYSILMLSNFLRCPYITACPSITPCPFITGFTVYAHISGSSNQDRPISVEDALYLEIGPYRSTDGIYRYGIRYGSKFRSLRISHNGTITGFNCSPKHVFL